MKIFKTSFIFVTLFFFAFTVNNARAAMTSYMEIEGIQGGVTDEGKEGTIAVHSLGHNLSAPYDPATGLPSGGRAHTPLRILKVIDKSSPLLYQALVTRQNLSPVIIKFYTIDDAGREVHYYTIELEDAHIISITPSYPPNFVPDNASYYHMESVGFVYGKIKWTHELAGIEFDEVWHQPKP
jgi:type VI secretion system secreted protein Hcp